jgi:hypothetical protein
VRDNIKGNSNMEKGTESAKSRNSENRSVHGKGCE